MRTTTKWLIGASAAILAATNVAVLVGVAYNRHGPPRSMLVNLTERELKSQLDWMWGSRDDSGLSLRLQFRTESLPTRPAGEPEWPIYIGGASPWLDQSKLAALGIDVSTPATDEDAAEHYRRVLGRDVLLVLELDGPAHKRALQAASDAVARLETASTDPSERDVETRLRDARESLSEEQNERSRLFVVDAGRDQNSLERRYYGSGTYAIVHGTIRPLIVGGGSGAKLYGMVTSLSCNDINVPLQFSDVFPRDTSLNPARVMGGRRFHVAVAFGRRLEPWIVSANAR